MQKIRIRLPATLTDFGPMMQNVGLALGLYVQVEISHRDDSQLIVEPAGQGAGQYAIGLQHPVVSGMTGVFQMLERAPSGMNIAIQNDIPLNSGLGAEAAFITAGVVAAGNILEVALDRDSLLTIASRKSHAPDNVVSTMLGGLTTTFFTGDNLYYRSLPLTPFKVILAVPLLSNYVVPALPDRVETTAIIEQNQRMPLVLEALREGNLSFLVDVLDNPLRGEQLRELIPGYAHVAELARLAGADGVMTSGGGPAMIFFTERYHSRIAEVVETAFQNLDIPAFVRVVSLDTQGIVISMLRSA